MLKAVGRYIVVVGAVMMLLALACEETAVKTLTVTGPDETTLKGDRFTATVTGVAPAVGFVRTWWYRDANDDEYPQQDERLWYTEVLGDINYTAESVFPWKPAASQKGKTVVLSVYAEVHDPGTNLRTTLKEEKSVKVK